MTIISTWPYANPDSAGLPVFDLPTAGERAIFENPAVLRWWRADSGVSADGWRCRKTGDAGVLVPERDGMPARMKLAAYSGRDALVFSATSQLWDDGKNLFPTGGPFSLVVVGRAGPNDAAYLVGAATDGNTAITMMTHQSQVAANGRTIFNVNSAGIVAGNNLTSTSTHYYADGPMLMIGSHDPGGAVKMGLRIDGGTGDNLTGSPANAGFPNPHAQMHVGGVNAFGAAISGALDGGDIAEILLLSVALHVDTSLRTNIETLMRARYGLW